MESRHTLAIEVCESLRRREQNFSIAESCTAGMLSASFATINGLSKNYQGGVVSYSNSSKETVLGVSKKYLEDFGAVSKEVALSMASGVKAKLNSDWGISVTGVAGPDGGTKDKPVGTVFFAVCGPEIEVWKKQSFSGDREAVQKQSIEFLLNTFINSLNN